MANSRGICGALYADRFLFGDEHRSQQLPREFVNRAGPVRCKQVLKLKYITYKESVTLTTRLLDDSLS